MELRRVGRSPLKVSPLCFGGNVFGWTVDEAASFELLDQFVAAGMNFVDTADMYSVWAPGNHGGESETIIGRWLKARGGRDRLIIATKVGSDNAPGNEGGAMPRGLSRRHIVRAVEGSLRRLQTDYVDLYLAHWPDPLTPWEETLEAMSDLVTAGKVRVLGGSNLSARQLRDALAVSSSRGLPRIECLQPHYNLYHRVEFEGELEQTCLREQLGVMTYFSLESGFLTGKYRSDADFRKSARGGSMAQYLNPRGRRILSALDNVAAARGATPAQAALAWLMARPAVTAPITSATRPAQLAELIASASLSLSPEEIRELEDASAESRGEIASS